MGKYTIKCDDCKKSIGSTDSMMKSAQGGRCSACRNSVYGKGIKAGI